MPNATKVLVTGAGGFIGHYLVKFLKSKGYWVRGVDIKKPEFEKTQADQFLILDLRNSSNCLKAIKDIKHVYNLAANMGGVGFIDVVRTKIMHDNVLIDTNMLDASYKNGVKKFFYSSSAVIYPNYKAVKFKPSSSKKRSVKNVGFKEEDAYPAYPDTEYGWEKLFTERLCIDYYADYGFETRIARFHNVYGPLGTYAGGREKSPAAICRKIALAKNGGSIEVWGNGRQMRSYCYVDDCVEGIYRLMQSNIHEPINIGSDRLVSINNLIDIVAKIAGKNVSKKYDISKPQGVKIRNSDNTLIRKLLSWEPSISLEEGMSKTYFWIKEQVEGKNYSKSLS